MSPADQEAGSRARQGSGSVLGDEIDAFDVPPECEFIFTDGFESGDTSAWGSTVP